MSAIICLPVDFRENSVGLPSLLAEEIDGAPVLYHTASRLSLSNEYRVVLVFQDGAEAAGDVARAREMLSDLDVEYFVSGAADVVNRAFLRRGRLWSLDAWRGGMGTTSYYDEAGRPAAMLEAAEKFQADTIGLITPESPYADPQLAGELLSWHRERIDKALVTVTGVSPGLAPAFFNITILRQLAETGLTFAASVAYKPGQPQRDLTATEGHFEADMKLRLAPWRLTACSRRRLEMMRALSALGASPRKATALEVVALLASHSELWSGAVPAKIEIEPTTRVDAAPFWLREFVQGRKAADIDATAFARILESLRGHEDVLLSLEGLGEPLLSEHLPGMVAAAKDLPLLGVHVGTFGRLLDSSVFEALKRARLDVLSVFLGAHTGEGYAGIFGRSGLDGAQAALEDAFALRRESEVTWPLLVAEIAKVRAVEGEIEGFFDYWVGRCDWPLISPQNDRAGQVEDCATIHMRTSERVPCRKIFTEMYIDADATAWPCRQDIHRTRPLGDAAEEGVGALWHSPFMEDLRRAHMAGDWDFFPLCRDCKDWYYSI